VQGPGSRHRDSGRAGPCQQGSHAERSGSTLLVGPAHGDVRPVRRSHRCKLGPGAPPACSFNTQHRQPDRCTSPNAAETTSKPMSKHTCTDVVPATCEWRPPGHTNPTMPTSCPPTLGPETRVSTQGHPCRRPPANNTQGGTHSILMLAFTEPFSTVNRARKPEEQEDLNHDDGNPPVEVQPCPRSHTTALEELGSCQGTLQSQQRPACCQASGRTRTALLRGTHPPPARGVGEPPAHPVGDQKSPTPF
jgi:hypothetical protein